MKLIDFLRLKFNKVKQERASTLIIVLLTFLPILILMAYLGIQFKNIGNTFVETKKDIQSKYAAEMGIERYKNQVVANHAYSDALSFSKDIDGTTYDIEVTSSRIGSGTEEKIKIISTVTGTGISVEKTILLSRFP